MSREPIDTSRRAFIRNGSLLLAFSLMPIRAMAEFNAMGLPEVANKALPGSLKSNPMLDAWIRIAPDGKVTVCSGKVELGTGVRTAMIQIAAEQLELMPNQIEFIAGDTSLTPNEGFTAGSHTIADSGTALLHASAQVATLLTAGAASQWKVDVSAVKMVKGRMICADGRQMHYGEAIKGVDLHRSASEASHLKDPRDYQLIGTAVERVDIPRKVTGGESYVQDMRPEGMVHARVVRPPRRGAKLQSVDTSMAEKLPGILKVVRDGDYLAVITNDEWHAIEAMRLLTVGARWAGGLTLPDQKNLHSYLQQQPTQDITILERGKLQSEPGRTVKARYTKSFVMHGSIGPSCSIAHFENGMMSVWTHTQGVFPLRQALAELLGLPLDKVRCIHTEGSGCYGQNGADDVAADAALLAKAIPGRPVRVQLMRDQENLWEPYAPAMVAEIEASVDADGKISNWHYELWSGSHNERPGNAGKLVPAWLLANPIAPSPSQPMPQPEGGGDRNAIPLYTVGNARVVNHFIPESPVRTSAMRSLGGHLNILAIESTVDALAKLVAIDPVEFRLKNIADPRAQLVIKTAAEKFGWPVKESKRNHGIGFAFGQYKNLMAYVAIALELSVSPDTGAVKIIRVVAAVDCGQIVNPDGARNQIEGGILQSASWTLYEQLQIAPDGFRSIDWATYPIMRFSAVPSSVEVHLINRPGLPFLGVAEAAQGPMAGALANALFHATGREQRALPLGGAPLKS